MKDKDAPPSYQYISSNISTEIDAKKKVMKFHHKSSWIVWESHEDKDIGKNGIKKKIGMKKQY